MSIGDYKQIRRLASQLAKAVRECLDRVRGRSGREVAERLIKIGNDCAAHQKQPFRDPHLTAMFSMTRRACRDDRRYPRELIASR